ncbi:MAG TPA: DUF1611 domain-containing protein [Thermoplasmatales archaeon]|nr:DUF1611 domain-containing protein [Thermoplasmatales archaeon]
MPARAPDPLAPLHGAGDNRAVVYVEGRYRCADGKTAHGLVRYSRRYDIAAVVDSTLPEGDAGELLDGVHRGIPLFNSLEEAVGATCPGIFIVGAVSEGSTLPAGYDRAVSWALSHGLHVVSGLHQFLSDNLAFRQLAEENHCTITDVRKLFRDHKRFYTGDIRDVGSVRVATVGTDSAVGKRTLAVALVRELERRGHTADMIYTGQTGWMQGWPHGVIIDAMINDFVAGGIEGAIIDSWRNRQPEFMIIEGQGSLVHPFFPGGFEILAAGQVHGFLLIHAPGRSHLDGFPGYPMPDPRRVVTIATLLSQRSLLGISFNRENLDSAGMKRAKRRYARMFDVPVVDPLADGVGALAEAVVEARAEDQP